MSRTSCVSLLILKGGNFMRNKNVGKILPKPVQGWAIGLVSLLVVSFGTPAFAGTCSTLREGIDRFSGMIVSSASIALSYFPNPPRAAAVNWRGLAQALGGITVAQLALPTYVGLCTPVQSNSRDPLVRELAAGLVVGLRSLGDRYGPFTPSAARNAASMFTTLMGLGGFTNYLPPEPNWLGGGSRELTDTQVLVLRSEIITIMNAASALRQQMRTPQ